MHPTTRAILQMILDYIDEEGGSPTLREIADAVGLQHASSVVRHLDHLEASGYISRTPRKSRSIKLERRPK